MSGKTAISMLQSWEKKGTRRSTCQKDFAATLIPCETRTLQKITIHMFQL
jgi:hypothetical protein